jgi:N-acetylmuramoyl-L-alanine amidase
MAPTRAASTALALCLGLAPFLGALAGEVRSVSVDASATGTRAQIELAGAGEYKTLSLSGPDRLVVDLPASSAMTGLKLPTGAGVVSSVRTGQPTPGTLRIVFDLAQPGAAPKPRMEPTATGARLVLEWAGGAVTAAAAPAAATNTPTALAAPAPASPPEQSAAQATAALASAVRSAAAVPAPVPVPVPPPVAATGPDQASPEDILNGRVTSPAAVLQTTPATGVASQPQYTIATGVPAPAPGATSVSPAPGSVPDNAPAPAVAAVVPPSALAGTRPLVIAIDAGHGGQDPGAVGPTGKHEKNVVLAIARELARRIDATPGMKAFLVRDGDYYIALPERARKARAAKADMFVSIHADAAENRNARGSSVYVLSLKGASSQRARWLANKENASDLIGGARLVKGDNTLSSVLLDLAQSGHMKASEDAANHVLDGLKRVGNNHKPHIERANFAVLRTSDMPAMLVETAFISNHDEEQRLMDPAYQRKVAAAVLDGVQTYFTRQPPPGTLFAARAQAEALAAGNGPSAAAGSP